MSDFAEGLPPANDPVERAARYAAVGRHEQAIAALHEALADDPYDPWVHVQLGRSLSALGRKQDAEAAYREALALDPESASIGALLAEALMDRGAFAEAEGHLIAALRQDPDLLHGWLLYGYLMHRTGHAAKAEKLLRRALELDPDSASAHALLGTVLADANRHAEAVEAGATSLGIAPDETSSQVLYGRSLLLAGRPFAARRVLRDALRQDPGGDDELFLEADRYCRWLYLPFYYWTLLAMRVPGGIVTVWGGCFVLLGVVYNALRLSSDVLLAAFGLWFLFVIYTWLATPMVRLWTRLVPPR